MFSLLLLAYIFFIPFVKLFYWPVVYAKIQANEFIFLALVPFLIGKMRKESIRRPFSQGWKNSGLEYLGLALLLYGSINLISGSVSGDFDAILEGLGRNYLLIVLVLVALFVFETGQQGLEQALKVWVWGAIAMSIITYLGYIFTFMGYPNRAVATIANYPYWGTERFTEQLVGQAALECWYWSVSSLPCMPGENGETMLGLGRSGPSCFSFYS